MTVSAHVKIRYPFGTVVRSVAGRDRKREFIVIGERDGMALVADGSLHEAASPKVKNPRHLKCIARLDECECERLRTCPNDETLQDILKRAISRTQTD